MRLSRSLNVIYWHSDDHLVKFQYGMQNADFPSPIAKKEFVLDFDCYSIGPIEASDAESHLTRYNELMVRLFERSIGQRLREDMGIVDEEE
jgi:uncharacterized protein (TIGR04255 family)